MFNGTCTRWILLFTVIFAVPALAAGDPTSEQVYEAARSGHLDQAARMIDQVLRDHPKSAKAHYVAAEVYAKEGKTSVARHELDTAQTLEPGLPFAPSAAVVALRRELAQGAGNTPLPHFSQPRSPIPWGALAWVLGCAAVIWLVFRRRSEPNRVYSPFPTPVSAGSPAVTGGLPGTPTFGGGGIGSGIAGGLASGLAVGAGVVAGEELARHFLDGNRNDTTIAAPPTQPIDYPDNSDMGGNDFGLTDDSSWDDSSTSGVDFSDDDWT